MKQAVVLVNLGTPAAATPAAVRRFLAQFLHDHRVVEVPRAIWCPILHGVILPFRPRRVARAYAGLWRDWGDSPLRVISERQCRALSARLESSGRGDVHVELAYTYGEPSIANVLARLQRDRCQNVLVLPLYPQYSATTTAAVSDQVSAFNTKQRDIVPVSLVKNYHDHPLYIEALAASVEEHWQQHGRGSKLLMSYHGIPRRNVELGDPYERHCQETSRRLAARLGLEEEAWQMSFQSRLGRAEWLQPYTVDVLRQWGQQKLASVDVICPAFAADCLETLEEMDIENRTVFEAAGGGDFRYISCLNDRAEHIDLLATLVDQYLPRRSAGERNLHPV